MRAEFKVEAETRKYQEAYTFRREQIQVMADEGLSEPDSKQLEDLIQRIECYTTRRSCTRSNTHNQHA